MRKLLLILLWIPCAALAGPQEEAMKVVERWAKAFAESDIDGIVKLHAPDALFFGTLSKSLVTKTSEVRGYFHAALTRDLPRGETLGEHSVLVVSPTVVVVSGLDNITGVRDGKPISSIGRVTFVVADRGQGWQIVHLHRSPRPN